MMIKRLFPLLLLPFLLTSCVSMSSKTYHVTSMSILNDSSFPVTNFQIYIPKRDRTLSINQIPPGAESSYGFPVRDYQGNSLNIRWTHQGRQYEVKNLKMKKPSSLPEVMPLNARFTLKGGTKATATLESAQELLRRVESIR